MGLEPKSDLQAPVMSSMRGYALLVGSAAAIGLIGGLDYRSGHGAGDLVLAAVANALRGSIRATDRICRAGGDEFIVLLPETGRSVGWRDGLQRSRESTRPGSREVDRVVIALS